MIQTVISKLNFAKVFFLSIISSCLTLGFIGAVNKLINKQLSEKNLNFDLNFCVLLGVFICLYALTRIYFSFSTIKLSQNLFWKLRTEVVSLMSGANYKEFKKLSDQITSCLINDITVLTQSAEHSIYFLTSLLTMFLCIGYLAYLSVLLFFITLTVIIFGGFVYYASFRRNQFFLKAARAEEDKFVGLLTSLTDGFKEISIDRNKKKTLGEIKLGDVAKQSIDLNTKAFTGISLNQLIGQILFFTLILTVLLYSHSALGLSVTISVNFVFILMFLRSAIETTMVLLPSLYQANIAYRRIINLKNSLNKLPFESQGNTQSTFDNFSKIILRQLVHSYPGNSNKEHGFNLGPIDLEISKGDVCFIFGSNGSGKTTLILLLLGLLKPSAGSIVIDDKVISKDNNEAFKMLFGVVFSDYFLFDQIFSSAIQDATVNEYLEIFELSLKVKWINKAFTTRDLSMGQRKRLALISVLLENKPIIVLDEWAADQDPYFRKKFYEQIIPLLKGKGFTIIAITHDDKYYHLTDYLYKMQEGNLSLIHHKKVNTLQL